MTTFWIIATSLGASLIAAIYLLERVIIPWRVKRTVDRIISDVKAGRTPKRTDYDDAVDFDANGFQWHSLKNPKATPIQFPWTDVRSVVAFKVDLLTYDEIRLRFIRSSDNGFEISEHAKGWSELTEALPQHLPGCKAFSEWLWTVAEPAFARNETLIFRRDTLSDSPAKQGTQ